MMLFVYLDAIISRYFTLMLASQQPADEFKSTLAHNTKRIFQQRHISLYSHRSSAPLNILYCTTLYHLPNPVL